MKIQSILLSAMVLTGCGVQQVPHYFHSSQHMIQNNRLRIQQSAQKITARSALKRAFAAVNKISPNAEMSDIDYYKKGEVEELIYYFHKQQTPELYRTDAIIINVKNGELTTEQWMNEGQFTTRFDFDTWKLDNPEAISIAKTHGFKGENVLGVLFRGSWSLADLDHKVYYDINSKTGKLNYICTDLPDGNMDCVQNPRFRALSRHMRLKKRVFTLK